MNRGRSQGKVMSWTGWLLLLGIILVVGLVSHFVLQGILNDKTTQRNERDALRVQEQGELDQKKKEQDEFNSPDYIVKVARENYDLVNRDEIHFEFDHPENLRNYTPEELAIWMAEVRH